MGGDLGCGDGAARVLSCSGAGAVSPVVISGRGPGGPPSLLHTRLCAQVRCGSGTVLRSCLPAPLRLPRVPPARPLPPPPPTPLLRPPCCQPPAPLAAPCPPSLLPAPPLPPCCVCIPLPGDPLHFALWNVRGLSSSTLHHCSALLSGPSTFSPASKPGGMAWTLCPAFLGFSPCSSPRHAPVSSPSPQPTSRPRSGGLALYIPLHLSPFTSPGPTCPSLVRSFPLAFPFRLPPSLCFCVLLPTPACSRSVLAFLPLEPTVFHTLLAVLDALPPSALFFAG